MKLENMVAGPGWHVRFLNSVMHLFLANVFHCIAHIAKKLCPQLILVPNNFSRYSEMSNKIMEIFSRYDSNMCPAGADEAYLKYAPLSLTN